MNPHSCLTATPSSLPLKGVSPALKRLICRGPHDKVHKHTGPPARSNGQWGTLRPFQSCNAPSTPFQLHGRRLSLCLVNYQPSPCIYCHACTGFGIISVQNCLVGIEGWMETYSDELFKLKARKVGHEQRLSTFGLASCYL